MPYFELLLGSSVALATVWFVYWAATRIASLIQSTIKEMQRQATDRPKTLSALGDAIDGLQIGLREVDTKVESALSLGRSNRAKITNMRRQAGTEESEHGTTGDGAPARPVPRLPGRK